MKSKKQKMPEKVQVQEGNNVAAPLQILRGRVLSAKLPQTVTVLVERKKTHRLYGKSFARSKKYLVHTQTSLAEGDLVEITQCKPISKNKHFKVLKVVGKDIAAVISEQLKEEAAAEIAEVMPEEKEEKVELDSKDQKIEEKQEEKEEDSESKARTRQSVRKPKSKK